MNNHLTTPVISIIIPTHNRCASLQRLLDMLCKQSYSPQRFEVIVVADGCVDGTRTMLARYSAPYALHVFEQDGRGAATARNHGAQHAVGSILIFLDDDIEPTAQLVEAHWQAHQIYPCAAVIGYLPPILADANALFNAEMRRWWERGFEAMREPGHRFSYSEFFSGNCSVGAELFHRIHGFDVEFFSCFDDFELGMRLLKAGAQFVFAPDAVGYHHESRTLDGLLHRKQQEGRAEIILGQRHPELKASSLVARVEAVPSPERRLLHLFAFHCPMLGGLVASCLRRMLPVLEWTRLRRPWRRLLDLLMVYWHYRGVAAQIGSLRQLSLYLHGAAAPPLPEVDLNLAEGIHAVEQFLDAERPMSARIVYGSHEIGYIPAKPGAERLRAAHLRPLLIGEFARPYLAALLQAGVIDPGEKAGWLIAPLNGHATSTHGEPDRTIVHEG